MIYIVIPVFNRWHFTKACVEQLQGQTYKDFKIVVVDDGSTDDTSGKLAEEYPEVIVLKGDGSLWWTGGINLGIEYALQHRADFVLSLNNDTLPKTDYLEKLMEGTKVKPGALIGSTGVNTETNQINFSGERVNWLTDTVKDLRSEIDKTKRGQLLKVTHFPGRGLLIPVKVFDAIGPFDQKTFPHYMADYDFTFRAIKAGFEVYCSVDAQLGTYPEASGANQLIAQKTWKNYKEHLFGMKGAANLKYYLTYVARHCPWYLLPISATIGTGKRLTSYWLKK
ncbi:glycosyltransferase family 2 protein [Cellulophaga sp. HaHa_2_95]|uniref:glycosyltransferase family 2 protein n=1 Tax=Cellulophaga sp. HaHa_2_95 TaxID=2745558 RepID=UPI001C4F0650|nr:glycosyltransferase family 2 protein [Cellulophaga sp. HaHa_2_95]QXP56893.1 glycosyltransferase family 2 protein [Cellulophaga sp. HaHa_2_95]